MFSGGVLLVYGISGVWFQRSWNLGFGRRRVVSAFRFRFVFLFQEGRVIFWFEWGCFFFLFVVRLGGESEVLR